MKTRLLFVLALSISFVTLFAQVKGGENIYRSRTSPNSQALNIQPPSKEMKDKENREVLMTPILSEGFDNIFNLNASGWYMLNLSSPVGLTNWFQGASGVFPSFDGAPSAYIAANFLNTDGANTISNWLISPVLQLNDGNVISFYTRTVDLPQFPDRLQLRLSTSGTSANVGSTSTSVGVFTTLLLDINPTYTTTGYPSVWTNYTVTLSGLGGSVSGRFALRYFVEDGGPLGENSDTIGIDRVEYFANGAPQELPLSNWAIITGIILIVSFTVIRLRKAV